MVIDQFIAVLHLSRVRLGGVAGDRILLNRIGDLNACLLFGQIRVGDCVASVFLANHSRRRILLQHAIRIKMDILLVFFCGRTDTILVLCIIPGLGDLDRNRTRYVRVGDLTAIRNRKIICLVAGDRRLDNRIDNVLTGALFRKICEGYRVGVVAVVRYGFIRIGNFFAICFQLYHGGVGSGVRTKAILVICIGPGLGDGNLHLLGFMRVDDVVTKVGGIVLIYLILPDTIADLFAIFELIKVREHVLPFAIRIRLDCKLFICFYSIRKQMDRDALRTDAILVVLIVPTLLPA